MPPALDTLEEIDRAEPAALSADRHNNSRALNIAMVLGALVFAGLCLLLAFGGGDEEPAITTRSTAAAESEAAAPAVVPAEEAPAAEEPVAEEAAPVEEATAAEAEPVAEESVATDAPLVEESAEEEQTEEPAPVEAEAVAEATTEEIVYPVIGADSPTAPPNAPELYSILSGGKLYMRGVVPSAEIKDQVVAAVEAIMGPGNAVSEYVIDPSRELTEGEAAPVYVDEKILFQSGSTEISPEFYELIGIAPILLAVQQDVILTVTGHTDDVGSAEANLALSQARVDAVRDWIISQGGDGERVIAVGYGEAEPITTNDTEEGRQANRRVEFIIEGFNFSSFEG